MLWDDQVKRKHGRDLEEVRARRPYSAIMTTTHSKARKRNLVFTGTNRHLISGLNTLLAFCIHWWDHSYQGNAAYCAMCSYTYQIHLQFVDKGLNKPMKITPKNTEL